MIHTWVLICPVMNFIILTPINLVHLCLLEPNTFPKKPARQKWTGPIYLPGHLYKLLSQEAKDALQEYNVEVIQNFNPSRNLHKTHLIHDVYELTEVCHITHFWESYGRCAMHGLPLG